MKHLPAYYNGKIACDEALEVVFDDPIAYSRLDDLGAANYSLLVFWIGQIFRYVWRVFGKDTPAFNIQKIVVCGVKALRLLLPEDEVNSFLVSLVSVSSEPSAGSDLEIDLSSIPTESE